MHAGQTRYPTKAPDPGPHDRCTHVSCCQVIDTASPEVTRPAQPSLPHHTEYRRILGERKLVNPWLWGLLLWG